MVCAVTTLDPHKERATCTVRTDHDSLKWMLSLMESSGRPTRRKLRLWEFNFSVQYRRGRVHQVSDLLSRLFRPKSTTDAQGPVEGAIPTFKVVNVLRPSSSGSKIFARTRRQTRVANAHGTTDTSKDQNGYIIFSPVSVPVEQAPQSNDVFSEAEREADLFVENASDDCDDIDSFDLPRASPEVDTEILRTESSDELSAPLTVEKLLTEQRLDSFCHTLLSRQSQKKSTAFSKDQQNGLLMRKIKFISHRLQIVVPESLRPRLLMLAHSSRVAGHSGHNGMYYTLSETYY